MARSSTAAAVTAARAASYSRLAALAARAGIAGIAIAVGFAIAPPRAAGAEEKGAAHAGHADHPGHADHAAHEMSAEQTKMMSYATPGEHHKRLEPLAGKWDAKVMFWPTPGGEPMTMPGQLERTWVLDGRFLMQKFGSGEGPGGFAGMGFIGYNNATNEYEGSWIDSEGTGIINTRGTMDAAGVLTQAGEYKDPATGAVQRFKFVTRIVSPTENRFEILEPGPDGKDHKKLEIVYTRVAAN